MESIDALQKEIAKLKAENSDLRKITGQLTDKERSDVIDIINDIMEQGNTKLDDFIMTRITQLFFEVDKHMNDYNYDKAYWSYWGYIKGLTDSKSMSESTYSELMYLLAEIVCEGVADTSRQSKAIRIWSLQKEREMI